MELSGKEFIFRKKMTQLKEHQDGTWTSAQAAIPAERFPSQRMSFFWKLTGIYNINIIQYGEL